MPPHLVELVTLVLAGLAGLCGARLITRALSRRLARTLRLRQRLQTFQRLRAHIRAHLTPPGPRRDIARLRSQLLVDINHTHSVLDGLANHLANDNDLLTSPARQLHTECAHLDQRLALLVREPNTTYLTELLPGLRTRVTRLRHNALQLRSNALELTEVGVINRELGQHELTDQLAGLHAGIAELHALTAPATLGQPLPGPPNQAPAPATRLRQPH